MEEADTDTAPRRLKPRFRKRRVLGAVLLTLPLLWLGWRSAVSRMDFPCLIIRPPLPALKPPQEPDGSPAIGAVALSPDGKIIWSGGSQPSGKIGEKFFNPNALLPIYAWDAHTGQRLYSLPGHLRQVTALACSPDGRWLASSGWDNTTKLWNTQTRQVVWSRPGCPPTLVFSPNSKLLASGGEIWDAGTGKVVRVVKKSPADPYDHAHGADLYGAAFSPDGTVFACVSDDYHYDPASFISLNSTQRVVGHRVQLWDVASGRLRTTLPYSQTQDVTYSPDGRWIACIYDTSEMVGGSNGGVVRVLDTVTGTEQWHFEKIKDSDWCMVCLRYSPNGKWLAVELINHDVVLFNAANGHLFKRLHAYELPHGGSFQLTHSALAFSSDGRTLVGRGDNTVQVWDTSSLP